MQSTGKNLIISTTTSDINRNLGQIYSNVLLTVLILLLDWGKLCQRVAFFLDSPIVKNNALSFEKIVSSSYITCFRTFVAEILLDKQIAALQYRSN